MKVSGKVLGVAAVLLLAASALGVMRYASAQEGEPPADGPRAELQALYAETLAANLGVSVEELYAASRDAAASTVDAAVEQGLLTPEQGERLKERIESSEGFGLAPFLQWRKHEHERHHRLQALRHGIIVTAAEAIGITPPELREELMAGKSIAQVAEEHGVPVEDVKEAILAAAEEKLEQAVENGRISEEQAEAALQRLTENIDRILNRTLPPPTEP